ncbi:hypothetical protein OC834_000753 [Tilletia horrida]|nr:hypothetical protein OC834_000753 [Tilletia horrida]
MPSFEHAVVFITGGGGAIGRGLAQEWIKRRVRAIIVSDINQEALDSAVKELSAAAKAASSPTQVKSIKADATVFAEINGALEQTVSDFGSVEYVHANAGAIRSVPIDLTKVSEPSEEWWSMFNSHFKSTLNTIHAAAPRLAQSKADDKLILITTSASSQARFSFNPPYGIAKAALNHIVYNYTELLPPGVRLTAFGPNWVNTPAIAPLAPFLEGVKTIEETVAAIFTQIDDPKATGVVTLHDPDGTLQNIEPRYGGRTDTSAELRRVIEGMLQQQQQQQ